MKSVDMEGKLEAFLDGRDGSASLFHNRKYSGRAVTVEGTAERSQLERAAAAVDRSTFNIASLY